MNELVNYTQILTGYVGSESFLRKIRDVIMRIKEKNPSAIYCTYLSIIFFKLRTKVRVIKFAIFL